MIKAVIFDMDGTLIDTEKYYRIFWPKALAHFGYEMSDEQALSMRSLGQPYAPQHLKDMFEDPDLDYAAIRKYRKEIMEECLDENGIEIKPGVFALLDFLKEKKIKRAIATATDTQRTEKYLKNLGEKERKLLQRKILSQNAIWKKIKSLKVKYLKNNQEISVEESLKKIIPKLKETEVFELIKFYYWCGKESMALQVINQIIYFAENSKEIKQQAQLEKDKLLREIMVKKIISRKGTTYSSLCKELNVRESFLIQILGREDEDR